jgi:hypothetical protein
MTSRRPDFFPFSSAFGLGLLASFFWAAAVQAQTTDLADQAHSRLGVQVLLNQGMTLLYGPARRALETPGEEDFRAFGGLAGSHQEVSGHGNTTVNGCSFLAGLGRRLDIEESPLAAFTYGFFGEGGAGRFETTLTENTEGRNHYVGGGFLLGTEFHNRVYMDGVFRVGRAVTTLEESGAADRGLSNSYFGAGGTLGWRTSIGDQNLDVYSRLLWSHQGTTSGIEEIDSTRFVFGSRVHSPVGEGWFIYAGAAWEYEFNGRAKPNSDWKDSFASLEGGSLAGEAGLELSGGNGFSARLGFEGAAGRRDALGGVLRLLYEF